MVVPGSKKYVKKTNKQTNKTVKLYKTIKKDNENRQNYYVKRYN